MENKDGLIISNRTEVPPVAEMKSDLDGTNNGCSYDTKRVKAIVRVLEKDLMGEEIKWSLFVAACQSYRYDSCLRPFPPMYIINGHKDIEGLLYTLDHTPQFPHLLHFLQRPDMYQPRREVILLLYWVLIQMKDPKLRSVSKCLYESVMKQVPSEMRTTSPNAIVKLAYGRSQPIEAKWKTNRNGYGSLYAYHGSRLENFYSILHHGLQQHLNKNALFGQGVYLSSELQVSLPYSPTGHGWGKSQLGGELSVVALCELIDHPSVHCSLPQDNCGERSRARVEDSLAGDVPNKYYVVANSDLVRVRYLLVYARAPQPLVLNKSTSSIAVKRNMFLAWICDHKLLTTILCYIFLLAFISFSHSPSFERVFKSMTEKIGHL